MKRPELIYLTAGLVSYAGGIHKNGHPVATTPAVVGTVGLVIVASLLGNTPAKPVVTGLGYLLLMSAVYGALKPTKAVKPVYSTAADHVASGANAGGKNAHNTKGKP